MFTFSFSTAFAASFDKNLATRYFEIAMDDVEKADGITLGGYAVEYATLASQEAEILAAVLDYCEANDKYIEKASSIQAILGTNANKELAISLVAAQYEADKAEALAILAGLDTSAFSTAEMAAADAHGCKTYVEHVEYVIAQAVKAINAHTFDSDSVISNYVTAKGTIDKYFDKYGATPSGDAVAVEEGYDVVVGSETTKVGLGVYKVKGFDDYKTVAVDAQGALKEANIAAKKAEIAAEYASYIVGKNATEKAKAANVKLVLDFLAEAGIGGLQPKNDFGKDVDAAVAAVADFEAVAAKLAAEVDAEGTLVRDAAKVAKLVKEGTINEYWVALGASESYVVAAGYDTIETCLGEINGLYNGIGDAKVEFAKAIRETYVEKLLAKFTKAETYYAAEYAKVEALTAEYLAKVAAVTDLAKFAAIDATYFGDAAIEAGIADTYTAAGKLAEIKTAAQVNDIPTIDSLQKVAADYATLENKYITKDDNKYDTTKLNAMVEKMVGESGARTAKEISALSAEAIALVKTLPTNGEVKAAKDAADDAIKALPTGTVTLAAQAAIDTAKEAVKAYETISGKTYPATALNTAKTKLAYAYNNALVPQVKAVDKTDKAAVKALISEITTFTTAYGTIGAIDTQKGVLEGYLDDIQAADAKAVEKAIAAIPTLANITKADAETVKAARAAYEAYIAEYTDTTDYDYAGAYSKLDGFVADDFAYDELLDAETALGLNYDENAEIIASVEGLKLKASSTKGKGWIKVTWKVTGDTENVEGYQLYKSTKAHSGYKKCITTTKTSFKNTKNIEKGERYYYKVRAFVTVDGVKYYSDWSNKANRVAI